MAGDPGAGVDGLRLLDRVARSLDRRPGGCADHGGARQVDQPGAATTQAGHLGATRGAGSVECAPAGDAEGPSAHAITARRAVKMGAVA